jgi:hypothetical protein
VGVSLCLCARGVRGGFGGDIIEVEQLQCPNTGGILSSIACSVVNRQAPIGNLRDPCWRSL